MKINNSFFSFITQCLKSNNTKFPSLPQLFLCYSYFLEFSALFLLLNIQFFFFKRAVSLRYIFKLIIKEYSLKTGTKHFGISDLTKLKKNHSMLLNIFESCSYFLIHPEVFLKTTYISIEVLKIILLVKDHKQKLSGKL